MREFSVPASFTVGEHDNVVSSVFSHERDDPDHVIFQRLVDGAWTDVTCKEAANQIRSAALGLIAEGVKPGDRVAVLSATRYEWPILDFAILAAGAVTVPIYETSSAEQVKFVLEDSGAVLIFAETDAHADKIEHLENELPELRKVLRIEGSGTPALDALAEAGKSVDAYELDDRLAGIASADPATLIYTSGTTGRPKGCQLTHSNLVYEIRGAKACFPTLLAKGERMLVFLPLAHVLARAITVACFANKVTLGFTSDIKNLVPTFGVFKPTLVVSVPRVFEKVYNTAEQNARNDGKGRIFELAANTAIDQQGSGLRRGRPAAAGQARAVRPAGVRQAARRAWRQLPRRDLGRRAAGRPARPLLSRRRPDHLRGLRPDRDQRGDHGEPDRRREGRFGRKVVAGQQHAPGRRRRTAGQGRRRVQRLLAQRRGDQGGLLRRLVPHRRPRRHRRRRLLDHHRPQEGDHRHRRRQERRARDPRGPAARAPADQPGDGRRRRAAVHRRTDHHRPRGVRRLEGAQRQERRRNGR